MFLFTEFLSYLKLLFLFYTYLFYKQIYISLQTTRMYSFLTKTKAADRVNIRVNAIS